MSDVKACSKCGEQLEDRAKFCPICGTSVHAAVAPERTIAEHPNLKRSFSMGALIPAVLLGIFLLAVLVITYYAGVASLVLAFGIPLLWGIITATIVLFGLVGYGVNFYLHHRRSRH